jgi:hypothetical protein
MYCRIFGYIKARSDVTVHNPLQLIRYIFLLKTTHNILEFGTPYAEHPLYITQVHHSQRHQNLVIMLPSKNQLSPSAQVRSSAAHS